MKLDSEVQRSELLELLGSVQVTVPMKDLDQGPDILKRIMDPITNAEIEEAPKTFTRVEETNDG